MSEFVNFEESAPFSYTYHNIGGFLRIVVCDSMRPRTCIQRQLCVYVSSVARLCIQRAVFRIISLWLNPNLKMLKSASGAPGPKSALRGTKSVTFTKAILQVFNLHKIAMNPIGDPSVLLIQSSEILSESSKGISVLPFPRPIYR